MICCNECWPSAPLSWSQHLPHTLNFVHLPCVSACCCPRGVCLFVCLFELQLSVCLWWHDYRRDGFPTLKFVVVIADLLAIW